MKALTCAFISFIFFLYVYVECLMMLNTLIYLGKEALNMCKAFSRKALLSFKNLQDSIKQ